MKRNNGGYVLVYVVVVIVILCILVPAACSNSLQNLKAQQASIERMQQLYAAEGEIERFVAEAQNIRVTETGKYEEPEDAGTGATGYVDGILKNPDSETVTNPSETIEWKLSESESWKEGKDNCPYCIIEVSSTTAGVSIQTKIRVDLNVTIHKKSEEVGNPPEEKTYYTYQITDCTITYESYDISTTTAGEGEN